MMLRLSPPVHVVVVDDSRRFVLHVWRMLVGGMGIGIGEQPEYASEDEDEDEDEAGRPLPGESAEPTPWVKRGGCLSSPCGCLHVWWIEATERSRLEEMFENVHEAIVALDSDWWEKHVSPEKLALIDESTEVREEVGGELRARTELRDRVWYLVDLKGKRGYKASRACKAAEDQWSWGAAQVTSRVRPVSAYRPGRQVPERSGENEAPLYFRAKCREVLEQLAEDLERHREGTFRFWNVEDALEILVTGAGFELADGKGGFGLEPTKDLLPKRDPTQLAVPAAGSGSRGQAHAAAETEPGAPAIQDPWVEDLGRLRKEGELDAWWNLLLEQALAQSRGSGVGDGDWTSGAGISRAMALERRLREEFRTKILRGDFGYLSQCDDAATLPVCAWLSTNYTRFADRAIRRRSLLSPREGPADWRCIATPSEGRQLVHEVTHLDRRETLPSPVLFKLHGDISHLETMAIAGFDKEAASPLLVHIDLSSLYASARNFLLASVQRYAQDRQGKRTLVWHVVGHGLADRLLTAMLADVSRLAKDLDFEVHFVLVGSGKRNIDREKRLEKALEASELGQECVICSTAHSAASYLARLRCLRTHVESARVQGRPLSVSEWLGTAALRPSLGKGGCPVESSPAVRARGSMECLGGEPGAGS